MTELDFKHLSTFHTKYLQNVMKIFLPQKIHKTIDIKKFNQDIIRKTIMASSSLRKVSRLQKLGQDRLITLLDKQDREIHGQEKIIIKQGNTT